MKQLCQALFIISSLCLLSACHQADEHTVGGVVIHVRPNQAETVVAPVQLVLGKKGCDSKPLYSVTTSKPVAQVTACYDSDRVMLKIRHIEHWSAAATYYFMKSPLWARGVDHCNFKMPELAEPVDSVCIYIRENTGLVPIPGQVTLQPAG